MVSFLFIDGFLCFCWSIPTFGLPWVGHDWTRCRFSCSTSAPRKGRRLGKLPVELTAWDEECSTTCDTCIPWFTLRADLSGSPSKIGCTSNGPRCRRLSVGHLRGPSPGTELEGVTDGLRERRKLRLSCSSVELPSSILIEDSCVMVLSQSPELALGAACSRTSSTAASCSRVPIPLPHCLGATNSLQVQHPNRSARDSMSRALDHSPTSNRTMTKTKPQRVAMKRAFAIQLSSLSGTASSQAIASWYAWVHHVVYFRTR
jgi:hypothetical protein